MDAIRIGTVSQVDHESGKIAVTYTDRDDSTTILMPYLTFNGEYHMPLLEQKVCVLRLSTGEEVGIALGMFWGGSGQVPPVSGKDHYHKEFSHSAGKASIDHDPETGELRIKADKIILETESGEITAAQIIAALGGA